MTIDFELTRFMYDQVGITSVTETPLELETANEWQMTFILSMFGYYYDGQSDQVKFGKLDPLTGLLLVHCYFCCCFSQGTYRTSTVAEDILRSVALFRSGAGLLFCILVGSKSCTCYVLFSFLC